MDRPAPDRVLRATSVLLDLDGVLYVEDEPIAGAIEAVAALRDHGLQLRFVTNTTSRPRRDILARLQRLGMPVPERELVTPARLAVEYCLAAGRRRALLLMRDEVKADFAGLQEVREGADVVVVGDLGEDFGYRVLNRAFRELLAGAELVALQKNRYWRGENGLSLDAGPFVAALEYASGKTAAVVGKPEKEFFLLALKDLGDLKTQEVAMVGDDPEADVTGAKDAGLKGVQVKTGKYVADAEIGGGADLVLESFAGLPEALGL